MVEGLFDEGYSVCVHRDVSSKTTLVPSSYTTSFPFSYTPVILPIGRRLGFFSAKVVTFGFISSATNSPNVIFEEEARSAAFGALASAADLEPN